MKQYYSKFERGDFVRTKVSIDEEVVNDGVSETWIKICKGSVGVVVNYFIANLPNLQKTFFFYIVRFDQLNGKIFSFTEDGIEEFFVNDDFVNEYENISLMCQVQSKAQFLYGFTGRVIEIDYSRENKYGIMFDFEKDDPYFETKYFTFNELEIISRGNPTFSIGDKVSPSRYYSDYNIDTGDTGVVVDNKELILNSNTLKVNFGGKFCYLGESEVKRFSSN